MPPTLFCVPNNPRTTRILVAASYCEVALNVLDTPPDFELGVTTEDPDFRKLFPLGKVPALLTDEGPLNETAAIMLYISSASDRLAVRSAYEHALVSEFMTLADTELFEAASTWVYPVLGVLPYSEYATTRAKASIDRILAMLEDSLERQTYLAGDRLTIADLSMTCALLPLFQHVVARSKRELYPNVMAWFDGIVAMDEFAKVVERPILCETEKTFSPEVFASVQARMGHI